MSRFQHERLCAVFCGIVAEWNEVVCSRRGDLYGRGLAVLKESDLFGELDEGSGG